MNVEIVFAFMPFASLSLFRLLFLFSSQFIYLFPRFYCECECECVLFVLHVDSNLFGIDGGGGGAGRHLKQQLFSRILSFIA